MQLPHYNQIIQTEVKNKNSLGLLNWILDEESVQLTIHYICFILLIWLSINLHADGVNTDIKVNSL